MSILRILWGRKEKKKTKNEEAFLFTYMERLSQSIAQLKKKKAKYNEGEKSFQ